MFSKKLPSVLFQFVLFSIGADQNLKKAFVNSVSATHFYFHGSPKFFSQALNTQKYVESKHVLKHMVGNVYVH